METLGEILRRKCDKDIKTRMGDMKRKGYRNGNGRYDKERI